MYYSSKEVHDEFNSPPPKPEYLSTAQGDYYKEFSPSKPAPTAVSFFSTCAIYLKQASKWDVCCFPSTIKKMAHWAFQKLRKL